MKDEVEAEDNVEAESVKSTSASNNEKVVETSSIEVKKQKVSAKAKICPDFETPRKEGPKSGNDHGESDNSDSEMSEATSSGAESESYEGDESESSDENAAYSGDEVGYKNAEKNQLKSQTGAKAVKKVSFSKIPSRKRHSSKSNLNSNEIHGQPLTNLLSNNCVTQLLSKARSEDMQMKAVSDCLKLLSYLIWTAHVSCLFFAWFCECYGAGATIICLPQSLLCVARIQEQIQTGETKRVKVRGFTRVRSI